MAFGSIFVSHTATFLTLVASLPWSVNVLSSSMQLALLRTLPRPNPNIRWEMASKIRQELSVTLSVEKRQTLV